jgi:hypothetical protein
MIKVINKELKEMLSEELYAQLEEVLKDKNVVIETQENFIPKSRFDEVNEKAKQIDKFADYEQIKTERDQLKADTAKYADYEELKERASKLDQYQDYDDIKSKYEETLSSNKKLHLKTLGFDSDFVDYALTKIEGDDFETAAIEFLNSNPKMRAENFQQVNSSLNLKGNGPVDLSKVTDSEEYLKLRKTHDIDGTPLSTKK